MRRDPDLVEAFGPEACPDRNAEQDGRGKSVLDAFGETEDMGGAGQFDCPLPQPAEATLVLFE